MMHLLHTKMKMETFMLEDHRYTLYYAALTFPFCKFNATKLGHEVLHIVAS